MINGIKVVGGQVQFKLLKSNIGEKEYAIGKAQVWLKLLQDKQVPEKWLKPTRSGTKINVLFPQNQEEFDASVAGLKKYIEEVNEKYGLDLRLV